MPRLQTALIVLLILFVSACAGSRETAMEPETEPAMEPAEAVHPLVGDWNYDVDTPQGVYSGLLSFAMTDGMLGGTIVGDEQPEQAASLTDLVFDAEASTVTFDFDGGEFGTMSISLTLGEEGLNGLLKVTQYGVEAPMSATRKADAE